MFVPLSFVSGFEQRMTKFDTQATIKCRRRRREGKLETLIKCLARTIASLLYLTFFGAAGILRAITCVAKKKNLQSVLSTNEDFGDRS